VEEGDLMLGFIELKRSLSGLKGECEYGKDTDC